MSNALYINGVFEENLAEILNSQERHPGKRYFLQPYATRRIVHLAKSNPAPENPITLYLSLTTSLDRISYYAKIVGWQDKRELKKDREILEKLNRHIKKYQPTEIEIYLKDADGRPYVNLISLIDLKRVEPPFRVSRLIKVSDGKPLKIRTRAGGWSLVREQIISPEKLTKIEDLEAELRAEVERSSTDNSAARQQRLVNAPKKPQSIQVVSRAFRRNPDVIAEVMARADGDCEACHAPAPFLAKNGKPYLEVHHRKLLSMGGEDTVENAVALCPNCHRKAHFGKSDISAKA